MYSKDETILNPNWIIFTSLSSGIHCLVLSEAPAEDSTIFVDYIESRQLEGTVDYWTLYTFLKLGGWILVPRNLCCGFLRS